MKSSPLISVIMPVFNCEKYVGQAIESVIAQTYPNWELLIGDDASVDGSLSVITQYAERDSRIKVVSSATRVRVVRMRNELLGYAAGDLVTSQDADDFSDKERFSKMVEEFRKNDKLGLLASQVGYVDTGGKLLRMSRKPTDYATTRALIGERNVVGGAIAMMRMTALESVGGRYRDFLDGLSYFDYDLSMLIAEKYEAYALPDVLYYYRQHPTSTSKTINIDRIIAKEVVVHLARQRAERGSDDVMDGRLDKVEEYFEDLRRPYRSDPSLVYREFAAHFMFTHLFRRAIGAAWKAVTVEPLRFVNWRTLQYCVRKSMLATMFG